MQQPLTSVQLSSAPPQEGPQMPPRPRSIEETGLSLAYMSDMMLRALYLIGEMTGQQLVELLHLPYENVIDQGIAYLRREQMCEIKGSGGIGEKGDPYQDTTKRGEAAKENGERPPNLGTAPEPVGNYAQIKE